MAGPHHLSPAAFQEASGLVKASSMGAPVMGTLALGSFLLTHPPWRIILDSEV